MSNVNPQGNLLDDQKILIEQLVDLGLMGFANEIEQQYLAPNLYDSLSFDERIRSCITAQKDLNSIKKFNTLYKKSRIKNKLYINDFTANPERGVDNKLLTSLLNCDYIRNGQNIIISGKTGTGKTALSCAAGVEAMKKGLPVMFYRMSDLVVNIESKDKIALTRFRDKLRPIKHLILDDYGLTVYSDMVVSFLNDVAEDRYNRGSTIFTTQLMQDSILKPLGKSSPTIDAFADRMFRSCDRFITIEGASFRGSKNEFKGENDHD